MKQRYVWIVEMYWKEKWTPTVGAAIDREQAKRVIRHWRTTNPQDKFRIVKYVAEFVLSKRKGK